MKDLKELKKLLLISLSSLIVCTLEASSAKEFLTKHNQKILELDKKINDKSATSLKYDWIEPIVASYTYSKSDQVGDVFGTSKYFRVSLDQPIFKSGGIYFAIQYANANAKFKEIVYKSGEAKLIKALYDGVLNLKKIDLEIQKTELSIKNAKIDIERKKEQFDSGLLDSSFLNSAILNKTKLQHQLLNLESKKFTLKKSFSDISDANYKEIELPTFKSVTKDEFLQKNLDISNSKQKKNQARELKNMTISNFLPTISLFGNYNHKDDEIQFFKQAKEYRSYGLRASMPLFSVNRGRTIEIKKLEYLKSKIALKQQQKASLHEYEALENSINILKEKVEIAKEDLALYGSLVDSAKDDVSAGEKTKLDLETLQNSRDISALDKKIYTIDIQLELLKLYTKMSDEI
jgi:outer membrane protein TolC